MNNYIKYENTILEFRSNDLFDAYKPLTIEEKQPTFKWKGGTMSLNQWQQILGFFLDHTQNEVQVRLYYHPQNRLWQAHAFPQTYPDGMSIDELKEHPNKSEDLKSFTDPWILFGSIHHHCTSSAFQSGKDAKDEAQTNGLHITVGNLDQSELDLHARITFHGINYHVNWGTWFETPEELYGLPQPVQEFGLEHWLKQPIKASYPTRWKENLIPKPKPKKSNIQHWKDIPQNNQPNFWTNDYPLNSMNIFDATHSCNIEAIDENGKDVDFEYVDVVNSKQYKEFGYESQLEFKADLENENYKSLPFDGYEHFYNEELPALNTFLEKNNDMKFAIELTELV